MKKTTLLATVTALLLGTTVRAEAPPSIWTVSWLIIERMQERGYTVTSKRNDKPSFRRSRGAIVGTFRLGEGGWRDVPAYKSENRAWKSAGTRRAPLHTASVSIALRVIDPKKPPKSRKDQARPPRKSSVTITRLGQNGKLDSERVETTREKKFQSLRRAGSNVERLFTIHNGPARKIVGYAGTSLTEPAGKIGVDVSGTVIYTFTYIRFGQKATKTVQITYSTRNGNGWVVPKEARHDDVEDVIFWAIAESEKRRRKAREPDRPQSDPKPERERPERERDPEPEPEEEPQPERPGSEAEPEQRDPEEEPRRPTGRPGGAYADIVDVYVGMGDMQREFLYIRAQLRAGVVAMKEERELLADVIRSLELFGDGDPKAPFYRKWKRELEEKIAQLEKERDELLMKAGKHWEKLRKNLEKVIKERAGDEALRTELEGLRDHLESRKHIARLELLLAAGKHGEFRRLLPDVLRNEKLAERGTELQALGLMEQGRMAEAYYALRRGREKFPKNETLNHLFDGMEASYLRMIANKAGADAAMVQAEWDKYTAGTERGLLWQAFFTGLKRPFHVATGKLKKLEAVHASARDTEAMTQNGIQLMLRLRKQGLSLEEISALDFYKLREWLIKLAPDRGDPSDTVVENFEVALQVAFENSDVKRLRSTGRTLMRIDTKSYYGQEEFEERWYETGLEMVSAKNVLLIFGPFAQVKGAGALTRFAQRMAGAAPARAAMAEQAASLTVQEWVYARPFMQEVAKRIAQSRAGRVIHEGRHVLRGLRYDSPALVRGTTAVTGFGANMAAHWLLMEGMGRVGREVGGEYGQLAGELLAGVVGVPGTGSVARLQERWTKSMTALKNARAQWQVTEAVLKNVRAPVYEATATLAAGQALTSTQRTALQRAASAADEAAATARAATAKGTASSLARTAADEADTLSATAKAALAGKTNPAIASAKAAKKIAMESKQAAKIVEQAAHNMDEIVMELGAGKVRLPSRLRRPRAPGSRPRVEGAPRPPRSSVPRLTEPPSVPPRGPPRAAAPRTVAELEEAARRAMIKEQFDDAAALLHTAARQLKEGDEALPRVLEALGDARAASRTTGVLARRNALPAARKLAEEADAAMQPFTSAQREALGKATKATTEELSGAGGARLITDEAGKAVAVWKPAARAGVPGIKEEGQLVAELLFHRLAKKLGLRVPHTEVMKLDGELGVVIRWIPNSTNLEKLSHGSRLALKGQVAQFRPLQIVTGNYDIHFGNLKLDRAGNVWAIDAGMSYVTTPSFPVQMWSSRWGPAFKEKRGVSDIVNWARWLRDWYRESGKSGHSYHAPVTRFEEMLRGPEVGQAGEKLMRRLTKDQIESAVSEVLEFSAKHKNQAKEIMETLVERRNAMPTLIGEHWGPMPGR